MIHSDSLIFLRYPRSNLDFSGRSSSTVTAGLSRTSTTRSISISRIHPTTVSKLLLSKPATQGSGTSDLMKRTATVGGESSSHRTINIRSQLNYSIFVQGGCNQNVDLSDHGNATPGTPVTLWGHWSGENQVWRFQEAS